MSKVKSAAVWIAVMLVVGIGANVISNAFLLPDSAWLTIDKMYVRTARTDDLELTLNIVRTVLRTIPVTVTISVYEQDNGESPCFDFSDTGVMRKGVSAYSQSIPGTLEAGSYVAEIYVEFVVGSFGIRRDVEASTSFVVVEGKGK